MLAVHVQAVSYILNIQGNNVGCFRFIFPVTDPDIGAEIGLGPGFELVCFLVNGFAFQFRTFQIYWGIAVATGLKAAHIYANQVIVIIPDFKFFAGQYVKNIVAIKTGVPFYAVGGRVFRVVKRAGNQEIIIVCQEFFQAKFNAIITTGSVANQTIGGQAFFGVYGGESALQVRGNSYVIEVLVIGFGFKTQVFAQHVVVGNYVMTGFSQFQVFVGLAVRTIGQRLLRVVGGHAFVAAVHSKPEANSLSRI